MTEENSSIVPNGIGLNDHVAPLTVGPAPFVPSVTAPVPDFSRPINVPAYSIPQLCFTTTKKVSYRHGLEG
jgi:hypothetical protein